jgi:phosphate transport system permease protein
VTSRALPDRMGPPVPRRSLAARRAWSAFALGACVVAALVLCVPIALLVWHLFVHGLPQLSLGFFVHLPKPVGEPGGGMVNAIVGTLVLVGIGTAFAVPVGVGTGIYLAEFGESRFAGTLRYAVDVLGGVPSIVVGVAVYGMVVIPMGHFSALAGGVALGILMLATIIRSTEEVVRLVPQSYRQAALALGAPRWRVVQEVVLPAARAGITTATMLSIARAAGETAPLLFTALGNRFWSVKLDRPIASLPVMIFDYARSPYPDWNAQAWTGALVLFLLITLLAGIMRWTTRRIR